MLPIITTTHAIPRELPATHFASTSKVTFCSRCQRVLGPYERLASSGGKTAIHRCRGMAAAHKPSISVPFC